MIFFLVEMPIEFNKPWVIMIINMLRKLHENNYNEKYHYLLRTLKTNIKLLCITNNTTFDLQRFSIWYWLLYHSFMNSFNGIMNQLGRIVRLVLDSCNYILQSVTERHCRLRRVGSSFFNLGL